MQLTTAFLLSSSLMFGCASGPNRHTPRSVKPSRDLAMTQDSPSAFQRWSEPALTSLPPLQQEQRTDIENMPTIFVWLLIAQAVIITLLAISVYQNRRYRREALSTKARSGA